MTYEKLKEFADVVKSGRGVIMQPLITIPIVALFIYLAIMDRISGEFITSIITLVIKSWWDSKDQEKRDQTLVDAALATPRLPVS